MAKRFTRSLHSKTRIPGAQGRIRTSVARKERQIYSLLPLTTRPPVQNADPSAVCSWPPAISAGVYARARKKRAGTTEQKEIKEWHQPNHAPKLASGKP